MTLNFFIWLYLLGVLAFTTLADFGFASEKLTDAQMAWNIGFAVWQQVGYGSILAWLVLFKKLKSFERSKVLPVLIFSIATGIWQTLCIFTGWDQVNNKWAIWIFFSVAIGIVGWLVERERKKEKQWLKKNAP